MKLFLCVLFCVSSATIQSTFKQNQLKFQRVKSAYDNKEEKVINHLKEYDINLNSLKIYLRAFKSEGILEVWAKNIEDEKFQKIYDYDICQASGELGPKRKQGDNQVPEGFYHINRYNPVSSFHLSVGINYPNKSDKILSDQKRPGGDIFIHGSCMTIGCLPMTDDLIQEIYILCVESKSNGQEKIPITIFPTRLTEPNMSALIQKSDASDATKLLWDELRIAYDLFNLNHKLPTISFLDDGRHLIIE